MNPSIQPIPPPKRRGIQPGQNVSAGAPQKLDNDLRAVPPIVLADVEVQAAVPEGYTLDWVQGVSREELRNILLGRGVHGIPDANHLVGYKPDGGIFRLRGNGHTTHLLSAEAKHQQNQGNAIERWFKNYTASILVAPKLACLVFATGDGAQERGQICKTLNGAFLHYAVANGQPMRQFNHIYIEGPSFFTQVEGFEINQMVNIIKTTLTQQLTTHHFR